jgi:hypothetical protein
MQHNEGDRHSVLLIITTTVEKMLQLRELNQKN